MAEKINNLGQYADLSALWSRHPEGGREGDYVKIDGVEYLWDKVARNWVAGGSSQGGAPQGNTVDGDLNVGGDLNVEGDANIGGDMTVNGTLHAGSLSLDVPLPTPKDGQSIFRSIVFRRSTTKPGTPSSVYTSFDNPVPNGWSDGIPSGEGPIWFTSRILTSDGEAPQNDWSDPALLADSDLLDVEFSPAPADSDNKPDAPNAFNRHGSGSNQLWYDPDLDAEAINGMQLNWIAIRYKIVLGGIPAWSGWAISLVCGEKGDTGDGTQAAYAVIPNGRPPVMTNRNGDLPVTSVGIWQRTTSGLVVSQGHAMWMSIRQSQDGVWGPWGDPVRVTSEGLPGQDGKDIEYIFKQANRLPIEDDKPQENDPDQDGFVPTAEGWNAEAQGVDQTHRYEWMSQRVKPTGIGQQWGDWSKPIPWSVYGERGMDGASTQFIFTRTADGEPSPARPDLSEYWVNGQGEQIPRGWTDDPMGTNPYYTKEWVSVRRKGEAETEWGAFSTPAPWSFYSAGSVGIVNGEWYINGQPTGVMAEGRDGDGVAIKGVVDYYSASDATNDPAEIGGTPTSLEGITSDPDIEAGDCYVVDYVNANNSGHLFIYKGSTGNSWQDKWRDLGEFRGKAGKASMLHIAWATSVTIASNGDVTAVTDFVTRWEQKDPTKSYDWVGLRVDNNTADEEDPTLYKWSNTKGDKGDQGEPQPWVWTDVEQVILDCNADGEVKATQHVTITAAIRYGNDYLNLTVAEFSVYNPDATPHGSTANGIIDQTGTTASKEYTYLAGKAYGDKIEITLRAVVNGSSLAVVKTIPVFSQKQGAKGDPGAQGPVGPCLRFRGAYDPDEDYVWDTDFRDCVKYNDSYWMLNVRTDGDDPVTVNTPASPQWQDLGNMQFVATDILLAENASIRFLNSNKLIFTDANGHKTAGINEDGQGSYKTYYTESPYGVRKDDNADGWTYYYNNDAGNTLAWMLGPNGVIVRAGNVSMAAIKMSSAPISTPISYNPNLNVTVVDRYVYTGDDPDYKDKVYMTGALDNNVPSSAVVGDGTYSQTTSWIDRYDKDEDKYYHVLPLIRIFGGKIMDRWEEKEEYQNPLNG